MITYVYVFPCGHKIEIEQNMKDESFESLKHPETGNVESVYREIQLGLGAPLLKGLGWFTKYVQKR